MMFALVSPSISSARLIATAARLAIARATSASSSPNPRSLDEPAHSRPSDSPPEDSGVTSRSAACTDGHSGGAAGRPPRPSSAASISPSAEAVDGTGRSSGTEASSASPLPSASSRNSWQTWASQEAMGSPHQNRSQLAGLGGGGDLLGQLGDPGQGVDPAALLVVELGVLDRAADQRGDVREQLERVLAELVRGLGVEHDHPDRLGRAAQDGDRRHRLEVLLAQQRHVLHARVGHRLVADELGRAMAGHPAGESLLDGEVDVVDRLAEHGRGGADRQLAVAQEIDEAGVAAGRLRGQLDDALQHRHELERGGHELDDPVQRPVLLAQRA